MAKRRSACGTRLNVESLEGRTMLSVLRRGCERDQPWGGEPDFCGRPAQFPTWGSWDLAVTILIRICNLTAQGYPLSAATTSAT